VKQPRGTIPPARAPSRAALRRGLAHAAPSSTTLSCPGGSRARAREGGAVGRPRWARVFFTAADSTRVAITRILAAHFGQLSAHSMCEDAADGSPSRMRCQCSTPIIVGSSYAKATARRAGAPGAAAGAGVVLATAAAVAAVAAAGTESRVPGRLGARPLAPSPEYPLAAGASPEDGATAPTPGGRMPAARRPSDRPGAGWPA
jgi:hypothetical protein